MADEEKDYQEDYYQLLKDESYKSLLSKEVQYDNARKRALKQTNASLGAMGMQSSGYGQTATSGIEGQYLQALEGANQQYQQEQMDIGQQEIEYQQQKEQEAAAKQYSDYQQFASMMTAAANKEDLDNLMNEYQLYDENGQFNYQKAVLMYGEDNAKQLQYLYNMQVKGIDDMDYQGASVAAGDWHSANATFQDQNGKTGKCNDEIDRFFNKDNKYSSFGEKTGYTPANGDVIKISANSTANASTIYIIYRDGKWYQATASQYSKAKNHHWFRSAKDSNSTYYWDDTKFSF